MNENLVLSQHATETEISHACTWHAWQRVAYTNVFACQVDAVIVCCSMVAPTPSLAAALVHRFGMRPDVITYNLAGMGCAASTVAVGLARELMQVRLLEMEYITIFFY